MLDLGYMQDILILLSVSIIIEVFMTKLKMSPVLGYLVVGALIGNNGFNIVTPNEYTESIAEFGVVFLLFVIGLELTFERLIRMRLHVFGFGTMQLVITTYILANLINTYFKMSILVSGVLAAALSLSSTAIVLQVLGESKRQHTQVGRLSLAVLLMQDFAVVPLLTIIPILTEQSGNIAGVIGMAMLKAVGTIVVITIIGRIFLRPFFSLIGSAKKEELFVTTALFIVLGASWVTSQRGLSTAMGAFLAGLLIAETEYRNKIEDSIMPFQGIFLSLFFITVGMSIDIGFIMKNFSKIMLIAGVLLVVKSTVIVVLSKIFRFTWGSSIHSGLLLSQGSEFAFILLAMASKQNIIPSHTAQLLLMVVAFTMAITPLLAIIGAKIEDGLGNMEELDPHQEFKGVSDLSSHVIIAGFGRVGRMVAYMLSQEQIDYIAIDSNVALVKKARAQGYQIYHGDMASDGTLKAVGANRAAAIVLSMSDRTSLRKATRLVAKEFKHLNIVVRVEDYKHGFKMRKLGASSTVATTIETGLQLGGAILRALNIPEHDLLVIKDKVRRDDYLLVEEIELFKGVSEG